MLFDITSMPSSSGLLFPENLLERLAPAVRVRRDRDARPAGGPRGTAPATRSPGQCERVRDAVAEHVAAAAGHLDAAEDHQARRGRTQFLQFVLGPQVVVFGDDDAVEPGGHRGFYQLERVGVGVGRVPAGVHVQVELHRGSFQVG